MDDEDTTAEDLKIDDALAALVLADTTAANANAADRVAAAAAEELHATWKGKGKGKTAPPRKDEGEEYREDVVAVMQALNLKRNFSDEEEEDAPDAKLRKRN